MYQRRDSGCLKRSKCGLFELLQHGHLAGSATEGRLRFKSSMRVSLRLRIANLPAGKADKIRSETATVIPKAMLKRPSRLGTVFNHGRQTNKVASEQTE